MQRFKVKTVSEYIKLIESTIKTGCIYRGESKKFQMQIASAFRSPQYDFMSSILEFYRRTANYTSDLQRRNFIAFSQHHGLPTNLLDYTRSPIVALYFAVDSFCDEPGYIYAIDNKKTVDISNLVENYDIVKQDISINDFFGTDERYLKINRHLDWILDENEELLESIYRMYSLPRKFGNGVKQVIECLKDDENSLYESNRIRKIYLNSDGILDEESLKTDIEETMRIIKDGNYNIFWDDPQKINFNLARFLLRFYSMLNSNMQSNNIKIFSLPVYMTYTPPNITDRVLNQSSLFVYQFHGTYRQIQLIEPDYQIEIRDKANIQKTLRSIGFDSAFIYGDFDTIGKQIRKDFSNRSEKLSSHLDYLL